MAASATSTSSSSTRRARASTASIRGRLRAAAPIEGTTNPVPRVVAVDHRRDQTPQLQVTARRRKPSSAMTRAQGKLVVLGDPEAYVSAPGADAVLKFRAVLAQQLRRRSLPWKDVEHSMRLGHT